jgi:hypothetical protein
MVELVDLVKVVNMDTYEEYVVPESHKLLFSDIIATEISKGNYQELDYSTSLIRDAVGLLLSKALDPRVILINKDTVYKDSLEKDYLWGMQVISSDAIPKGECYVLDTNRCISVGIKSVNGESNLYKIYAQGGIDTDGVIKLLGMEKLVSAEEMVDLLNSHNLEYDVWEILNERFERECRVCNDPWDN